MDNLRGLYVRSPSQVRKYASQILALLPPNLRYGATYRRFRAQIEQSETDPEFVAEYRLKQLRQIISACAKSSAFYQDVFQRVFTGGAPAPDQFTFDHLCKLPILNKIEVRDAPDMFLVKDRSEIDIASTSGSSGKPLKFYLDRDRGVKEWAFVNHVWSRIGYRTHHRRAVLRGLYIPEVDVKPWEYEPALGELRFSPFHLIPNFMDDYLRLITEYKIQFIHGYPSAISILANHAKRTAWEPPASLIGVLPISESLFPYQRKTILNAFGKVAISSFYGLSEKVAIAGELATEPETYEFEPLYGYAELVNDEGETITRIGETGRIVGTGFVSQAMPLLRYDTGDSAELVRLPSRDNCHRLRVKSIRSRWGQEFIVGSNGALISMTAINIHSPVYARIQDFQFYQDTPGEATVRIIPIPGQESENIKPFIDDIQAKVGASVRFTMDLCDEIATNERGKRVFIDQRIDIDPYLSEPSDDGDPAS